MAKTRVHEQGAKAQTTHGAKSAATPKTRPPAKRQNNKKTRLPSAAGRKGTAAYNKALAKAGLQSQIEELANLAYQFELLGSGRAAYCLVPEIIRFVTLTRAMLAAGTLTEAQLHQYVCYSQLMRYRKIEKYIYLQKLAERKRLTKAFLDKWSFEQEVDQAGEKYAKKVGLGLLKEENKASNNVFESLAETTARTTFGTGRNAKEFQLPKGFTCVGN